MNEFSLHSEIKKWYSLPEDQFEVRLGNYIVDILRGDLIIEVQTKNFSAIRGKLETLIRKLQGEIGLSSSRTKTDNAYQQRQHSY
jgi:hypothetical protein